MNPVVLIVLIIVCFALLGGGMGGYWHPGIGYGGGGLGIVLVIVLVFVLLR